MRPATARSGQALPVHATRPAAAITATLASASLRLNSQIARTLASPSRKRASTKADTTLIASATTPIVPSVRHRARLRSGRAKSRNRLRPRQAHRETTPASARPLPSPVRTRQARETDKADRPVPRKSREIRFQRLAIGDEPPNSSATPKPRLSTTDGQQRTAIGRIGCARAGSPWHPQLSVEAFMRPSYHSSRCRSKRNVRHVRISKDGMMKR
ncbi:hypothetical protein NVSP9465_03936 [Novosphingobium sp. CECT 9465]|nr:hypothetical protein NVSP9465_03936 [Novosphingobium sp. CECT 9465]